MNIKLFIYMAIVVAEIICGYVGFREGVYVLKPLIMLSLIYWHLDYLKTHPLLWIGMWFGLGGDVFLMFSGTNMFMAGPVSYTHLDVYKRQLPNFFVRLRSKKYGQPRLQFVCQDAAP